MCVGQVPEYTRLSTLRSAIDDVVNDSDSDFSDTDDEPARRVSLGTLTRWQPVALRIAHDAVIVMLGCWDDVEETPNSTELVGADGRGIKTNLKDSRHNSIAPEADPIADEYALENRAECCGRQECDVCMCVSMCAVVCGC